MQIGNVIRKYRKSSNMTQEEMAHRLGVTAPAVNKWENGNSLPDIMLLAPIARLLNISLDTLLSFRDELTEEEIRQFVDETGNRLKNEPYEEVFLWVKKTIEMYPNCLKLILNMAEILDAWRVVKDIPGQETYDEYILECYTRVLTCDDETLRTRAADALFVYYTRNKQYEKAEKFLDYFSVQNPERKRKQAEIYSKTGKVREAYKEYEELLFSGYNMLVEKQRDLANVFEMGDYHTSSARLELATAEKDIETTISTMKQMLQSVDKVCSYTESDLYKHMEFKEISKEFYVKLKEKSVEVF